MKRIVFYLILPVFFLMVTKAALSADILIIKSYHAENTWTKNCLKGVTDTLGSEHNVEVLYMDTKRKPKSEFEEIASTKKSGTN